MLSHRSHNLERNLRKLAAYDSAAKCEDFLPRKTSRFECVLKLFETSQRANVIRSWRKSFPLDFLVLIAARYRAVAAGIFAATQIDFEILKLPHCLPHVLLLAIILQFHLNLISTMSLKMNLWVIKYCSQIFHPRPPGTINHLIKLQLAEVARGRHKNLISFRNLYSALHPAMHFN